MKLAFQQASGVLKYNHLVDTAKAGTREGSTNNTNAQLVLSAGPLWTTIISIKT